MFIVYSTLFLVVCLFIYYLCIFNFGVKTFVQTWQHVTITVQTKNVFFFNWVVSLIFPTQCSRDKLLSTLWSVSQDDTYAKFLLQRGSVHSSPAPRNSPETSCLGLGSNSQQRSSDEPHQMSPRAAEPSRSPGGSKSSRRPDHDRVAPTRCLSPGAPRLSSRLEHPDGGRSGSDGDCGTRLSKRSLREIPAEDWRLQVRKLHIVECTVTVIAIQTISPVKTEMLHCVPKLLLLLYITSQKANEWNNEKVLFGILKWKPCENSHDANSQTLFKQSLF